jgi:hypothetical protein
MNKTVKKQRTKKRTKYSTKRKVSTKSKGKRKVKSKGKRKVKSKVKPTKRKSKSKRKRKVKKGGFAYLSIPGINLKREDLKKRTFAKIDGMESSC